MDTSTRIATAMAELLRIQGYAATSMKELSVASASSVGSIYHGFPGGKAWVVSSSLKGAFVMARARRGIEPLVASGRATAAVCRSFGSTRRVRAERVDARTAR